MKPEFKKLSWEQCVKERKNPNPDQGGTLYSLGSVEEIRKAGSEAFQRMKKAFALQKDGE